MAGLISLSENLRRFFVATLAAGKKAALAAVGAFSGVGAAVAYKLDQSVKVSDI